MVSRQQQKAAGTSSPRSSLSPGKVRLFRGGSNVRDEPRTTAGGTSPPAVPWFSGAAQPRRQSQPDRPRRVLPQHGFPVAPCPPAGPWWPAAPLLWLGGAGHRITGRSRALGGRVSRAATSSSSPTSPAMVGGESGGFSLAVSPPTDHGRQEAGSMTKLPAQHWAGEAAEGSVPLYWRSSRARPPGSPGGRAGQ